MEGRLPCTLAFDIVQSDCELPDLTRPREWSVLVGKADLVPQISLTDLVDIVSRSGTPKANKVTAVKRRPDYEPAFDFYLALRNAIVETHRKGLGKDALRQVLATVSDGKKRTNYPAVIDGYLQWWGRKKPVWFDPPREVYSQNGMDVIVNPELGLALNDKPHVIKLYFKDDNLSKLRVDVITQLMELALRPRCKTGEVMCVLDIRNSKLFACDPNLSGFQPIINAELAYISTLWSNV